MSENPATNSNRYIVLGAAGAAIGLLAGLVMRPTFMGVKIPLGVLTSNYPGDAPFKSELLTHLGIYLAIGGAIGCVLAYAVVSLGMGAAARQGTPNSSDTKKWQALVEFDPEIAAQARRIAAFGQPFVDELAQKYLAIGDKAYLPQIADQIAARAEAAAAAADREAKQKDRDNRFHGFRCFHDEQGRFIGEVSIESGVFHVFPSQAVFEEAVLDFIGRGRPSIMSRAISTAPHVSAAG